MTNNHTNIPKTIFKGRGKYSIIKRSDDRTNTQTFIMGMLDERRSYNIPKTCL